MDYQVIIDLIKGAYPDCECGSFHMTATQQYQPLYVTSSFSPIQTLKSACIWSIDYTVYIPRQTLSDRCAPYITDISISDILNKHIRSMNSHLCPGDDHIAIQFNLMLHEGDNYAHFIRGLKYDVHERQADEAIEKMLTE